MHPVRTSRLAARVLAASVLGAAASAAVAQTHYTATLFEGPQHERISNALAMNLHGEIVGSQTVRKKGYSLLYRDGRYKLFNPPGADSSAAYAVSSAGDLAGLRRNADSTIAGGYLKHAGGGGTTPFSLVDSTGTDVGFFNIGGVNAAGTVVGSFIDTAHFLYVGYIWRDGVETILPSTSGGQFVEALAINDAGTVVGFDSAGITVYAAQWTSDGVETALPSLPRSGGCTASAISPDGRIVGSCTTSVVFDSRAVLWQDGVANDLGLAPHDAWSAAHGINSHGVVVGGGGDATTITGHAVIWRDGKAANLNQVTTLPAGAQLFAAIAIADDGTILGNGKDADGYECELVLTPDAN